MYLGYIFIFFIGIALSSYGLYFLIHVGRLKSLHKIPTSIIEIYIKKELDSARSYHKEWFSINATYEYQFNKLIYSSNRIGLDRRSSWYEELRSAEIVMDKLRQDSQCFVNVQRPGYAVLLIAVPSSRIRHYLASALAGLLLIGVACILTIFF